ncbi:MAG: DEAD/DEAH box helicase [Tannerellaceae bacterium]|jgi:superfamily II DNA or RNA helicase|nr:DEAD/DEAH box helicase [Tannerellaceae bacterium]
MAEQFGKTWWGERWIALLTGSEGSKPPRGTALARGKAIRDFSVAGNTISAKVKGTRGRPFVVTIKAPTFSPAQIDKLISKLLLRPALIARMLNGELPPAVAVMTEELGIKVFPRRWADLQIHCTCTERTVPCRHVLAIVHAVSRNIDNNPFAIYNLRGVSLMGELKKRGIFVSDLLSNDAVPPIGTLLKGRRTINPVGANAVYDMVDYSQLRNMSEALAMLLPDRPAFYAAGNFREQYSEQMHEVTKGIARILSKSKGVSGVFPYNNKQPISRKTTLSLMYDAAYQLKIVGTGHRIKRVEQMLAALFYLNPSRIADYNRSVVGMRKLALAALHLTANGMIIPQIIRTGLWEYAVRWLPAVIDQRVKTIIDKLSASISCDLLLMMRSEKGQGDVQYVEDTVGELLSIFIGRIVARLAKANRKDVFDCLFFANKSYPFKATNEAALPLGVKAWLSSLHFPMRTYTPVFTVSEQPGGNFSAEISVERNDEAAPTPVSFQDIMSRKKYEGVKYDITREIVRLAPFVSGVEAYIDAGGSRIMRFSNAEFANFLTEVLPAVRLLGVRVMLPKSLQTLLHPKVSVKLSKTAKGRGFINMSDLLSFNWQVALGDTIVSPEEFEAMLKTASRLFKFKESYIYVSDADIERIRKAIASGKPLTPSQMLHTALTDEYEGAPVVVSDEVRELIHELNATDEIALPNDLNAQMRPYQSRGYSWMYRNSRIGFGSIIADDMGLGKTLQVIAVLLKYKEEGLINNKHKALVVVPTGLLTNWQAEVEKFAPSLSIYIFHGQSRDAAQFEAADVMLTTYGLVRTELETLKKQKWQVMVIDEAQNIKNYDTAQAKAVKSIPAGIRIAMSGTPVENRLAEFWSIMDYTNKGYLGTIKTFKDYYGNPIQLYNDSRITERFRKVTAPFMMRRMKTDKNIISDLPDKIELNQYARLTTQQAALYEKTMQSAMQQIESVDETDSQSIFKRDGLVLQMILSLKQICNHPTQFLKNDAFDPSLSGKTELLLELLDSIVDSGEKALVFTQFTEMGQLLERFITQRFGEEPMFYHGGCSVKQRSSMVDRFQNNHSDSIFILSLKAAGTGLNLTAASHVIHYDLWWNPAVENQATDRAYRIGQDKNVMVHRLICKDTFEERIDDMIQQKKHLADMTVASGESWIGKLSNKELREIFGS